MTGLFTVGGVVLETRCRLVVESRRRRPVIGRSGPGRQVGGRGGCRSGRCSRRRRVMVMVCVGVVSRRVLGSRVVVVGRVGAEATRSCQTKQNNNVNQNGQ